MFSYDIPEECIEVCGGRYELAPCLGKDGRIRFVYSEDQEDPNYTSQIAIWINQPNMSHSNLYWGVVIRIFKGGVNVVMKNNNKVKEHKVGEYFPPDKVLNCLSEMIESVYAEHKASVDFLEEV